MNFNNSKINIYSLPKNELINALTMHKFSSFYIKSLIKQIFLGNIGDFKQLNFDNYKINILNDNFILNSSKIIKVLKDKNTTKFLIELYDKNVIEAVVLNYDHGNTLCVSTQVGCNMGCKFCASGINKKIRNLEVNEIIEQFILIKNDQKIKIKNIVFMGIGEPLDNYDNLTKSLKIFIDMLLIGPKHITVSTCGIMNKLQDFKNNFPNISIALSLHSCFDDIRSKLMPINNAYNLDQIITWIKTNYPKKSSKKLTIEYTLIENINDRDEDIEKIITLLKETNVLINVISYNKVINSEHQPSRKIDTFVKKLISNGFKVTTRLSLGNDINAACGQLRINYGKV